MKTMETSVLNISAGQLRKAARIKEGIDKLERKLVITLNVNGNPAPAEEEMEAKPVRHHRLSPEVKAHLSKIAKKRWRNARRLGKRSL